VLDKALWLVGSKEKLRYVELALARYPASKEIMIPAFALAT